MEIVFKELIKLNEVIREGSNPIQWRPYKKKKNWTQICKHTEVRPCENTGRR